jgi:hypothetical protein
VYVSQLNCNIPYIECFLKKEYTGIEDISGFIFGAKSLINYPLLFHFQGSNGAVVWNLPISAFYWKEGYESLSPIEEERLSLLESWDCQSSAISAISFSFLENKRVDVFCRDGEWRTGTYLFTLDDYPTDPNTVNVGYSSDLDSKCFHFIKLNNGNFCVQPNNLLRWHNPDFIKPYPLEEPPKFKLRNPFISSENIDMTYAKSPYYFYRPEKF